MTAPEPESPAETSAAVAVAEPESADEQWVRPPFQPLRAIAAVGLTAAGFGLYELVLATFWSSPAMGIHDRIPWPAFVALTAAIALTLGAIGVALGIWSPHAKLGIGLLAFLTCVAVAIGGGRFVSYTMRGTLNPPFRVALHPGDRFPSFALADQNGAIHSGPKAGPPDAATLVYVYRGDFCPFARFELAELTTHAEDFRRANVAVLAISADPIERSKMLAAFLHTSIPLLSDAHESILAPMGLVQRHRNGEPDNAIPAFFIVDGNGVVRWVFTSAYYREMPAPGTLLEVVRLFRAGAPISAPAPPASPS